MSLNINIHEKSTGVYVINLSGTLDTITHTSLEKQIETLLHKSPNILILDMEKLDYISSMGLRVIAKAKKSLSMSNGSLMLVNLQPQITEVFDIIKALPKEQIFSNINELDDYLLTRQQLNIESRKNN